MKHLFAIGGIVLAAVVLTAGCSWASNHNDQDVSFARDMVPHHRQGITMSELAVTRASNPQVRELATRIKASQASEIDLMNGWLETWKEKAADHGGHDMAGMKGMVSTADMRTLEAANGPEYDRLFLQRMTSHHQGAAIHDVTLSEHLASRCDSE